MPRKIDSQQLKLLRVANSQQLKFFLPLLIRPPNPLLLVSCCRFGPAQRLPPLMTLGPPVESQAHPPLPSARAIRSTLPSHTCDHGSPARRYTSSDFRRRKRISSTHSSINSWTDATRLQFCRSQHEGSSSCDPSSEHPQGVRQQED
jgi:hypothetical protein